MKFKKGKIVFAAAVLMLNTFLCSVTAETTSFNDFSCEVLSESIKITGYTGVSLNVTIPDSIVIGGTVYPVTEIGEYAFEESAIESIIIPSGVTKISEGAFYNCDGLTEVTVPESVSDIGLYAFDDCNNLTNVTVLAPNAVIGDSAFGYYYSGRKYYVVDNFVMHGFENSTAQQYAEQNKMTFEVYVKPVSGDVNKDKVLDIRDLVRLKKILAGAVSATNSDPDVNGDGIYSAEDLVCLKTIMLYGEDNLEMHTVTFKDKEGNILNVQKVRHSFAAEAPEAPVIDNYKFIGWSGSFANVMEDMEITALYEADNKPTFTVGEASVNPGDTGVVIAVSVKNNPGIVGVTLSVKYDQDAMTLTNASNGEALDVLTFTKANILESGCNFLWDGQEISENDISNGTVLYLTFDISGNASSGTYPITVEYSGTYDNDLNPLIFEVENGSITVS